MKLNKRKGFTIVELVIVIAVIAILAAVLIPNISNLVKKANASADETLVRNLNTALSLDVEKHLTMDDALEAALENGGYDLTTIVTKNKDNKILWDSKNDCFVYLNGGTIKYLPNTQEDKTVTDVDYFEIVELNADGTIPASDYSVYLAGKTNIATPVKTSTGLDVGKNTVAEVVFETNESVSVLINTNGGKLTVDASQASVTHRGVATIVTIDAVATKSYHEMGKVDQINLAAGRVVVESKAEVGSVLITATDITDTADGKNVSVEVEGTASLGAVAANNATAAGKLESAVSGTTDVMKVVADNKGFAGGFGTEKAPYLIADGTQFANMNNLASDMISGKSYYFKQVADITVSSNYSANGFAGEYDGAGYKIIANFPDGNFKSLFNAYQITGFVCFKNINVVMSNVGVNLLACADWGTSFGGTFDNITFNSTVSLVKVNCSNFGFIVFDALNTKGENEPVYTFSNITNNVNLQNEGTCTGFIVGSGPLFHTKTTVIYKNCVNNGNLTGTASVGFLYGNSAYINTVKESNSQITVADCFNKAIISSPYENPTVAFAPKSEELNNKYQASAGGSFIANNFLKDVVPVVNQNGSTFTINTTDSSVSYKLAFNVQAIYTKKDNSAWTADDVTLIGQNGQEVWDVSNGRKYFIDLAIDTTATGNLTTIKAYDKKTAFENGISVTEFTNGFAIVVTEGATYIIFDVNESTYINSSVSLLVYAYDANQNVLGIKTLK